MRTGWMKLALAMAFGMATSAVAIPNASANLEEGCSATCSKGTCSTGNSAKDCGCCGDGTPYCGAATDCAAHATSVVTTVARDIVEIGGEESGWKLVDSLKYALAGSKEAWIFVDAMSWFTSALLGGSKEEISAAQEYLNDSYSALPDEDSLIALRVTLNGMASPAAPPTDPPAPPDAAAPPAPPADAAAPAAPPAPPADAKAPPAPPAPPADAAAPPAPPADAKAPPAPPADPTVPAAPAAVPAVPPAE